MIDPRVTDAIRKATADLDQPPAVADRLLSWLDALTEGNELLTNVDDTARRCQLVYDATTLTDAQIEEEA